VEQPGDAGLVQRAVAVTPACTARFSTPERAHCTARFSTPEPAHWGVPGVAGSSPPPPARPFCHPPPRSPHGPTPLWAFRSWWNRPRSRPRLPRRQRRQMGLDSRPRDRVGRDPGLAQVSVAQSAQVRV